MSTFTKLIMPPEWARHERVWIGFPHDRSEWPEAAFEHARAQISAFAEAVADEGRGEAVHLIVNDAESERAARDQVSSHVHVERMALGDVWLRDTAPMIVGSHGRRRARDFAFNGWGGKFEMAGDADLGARLADAFGFERDRLDWVLEGGAIDVDGAGLGVTTEQCLAHPNRNPNLDRDDIERLLRDALGIERLLWLNDGLANDHTDGHVDNLARFVAPGTLLLPEASGGDDPNARAYADARERAEAFGVRVETVPSPGRIEVDGAPLPASFMNFYIGNRVVAMPAYGTRYDHAAVAVLERLFPDRRVAALPSDAILTGGGSFHCCSQQVPA